MVTNRDDVAQESLSGKSEDHAVDDNIEHQNKAQFSEQSEEQHRLTPPTYDIPSEDRTVSAHTYISDVDQQRLIKELSSEVALLREDLNSLSKRIEKLESK